MDVVIVIGLLYVILTTGLPGLVGVAFLLAALFGLSWFGRGKR